MQHKKTIKIKTSSIESKPIKDSKYNVTNWGAYDKNLKNRDKLSLSSPRRDLKSQFINDDSYSNRTSSRSALYSSAYSDLFSSLSVEVK